MAPKQHNRGPVRGKGVLTKNIVRQMINANLEMSYFTVTFNGVITAGTISPISQICTLGDSTNQRRGQQIIMKELRGNVAYAVSDASAVRGQLARMIVFSDELNIGSAPAVTDVLNSSSVESDYSASALASKRFRFYWDKVTPLSINGPSSVSHRFRVPSVAKKITFLGDTNATASNGAGSLWILFVTNQSTNGIAADVAITVRFHDG